MTPDEQLFDDVLSQALNILRLSASKRAETVRRLQAMADEMVASLQGEELTRRRRREINKFLSSTEALVERHYSLIQEGLELSGVAETVSLQTANSLQLALGLDSIGNPRPAYFNSVHSNVLIEGNPSADWWRGQSQDTARRFTGVVRQGLLNGDTNNQIIRRIVGTEEEPGAMDIARRHAASLVQTSVQAVANDARRETFDANADVIKGIRQVSTLDGRTTKVCIAYSNASWNLKKEPLDGSPPFNGGCPRHFNCRSVEVPIVKTFREMGLDIDEPEPTERASADGPIAADTTFDDFLRRKGQAFQDDVLGPGRAELWRDGKITLRDLVSGEGRQLTLPELREYASTAFSPVQFARRADDPNVTPDAIIDAAGANTRQLIREAEAEIKRRGETKSRHWTEADGYSAERQELHRRILYDGVEGYDPKTGGRTFYPGLLNEETARNARPRDGEEPTMTILGGRGGSGKSAFNGKKYASARVYDEDRALVFDADHIKHMLPEYRGANAFEVHEESSDILKTVLAQAQRRGLNVVLDGTLKSYDSSRRTVDSFRRNGYRIEAHYMHLPRQQAAQRAIGRFMTDDADGSGRYVPVSIILDNTDNELNFMRLTELADVWSFRDNDVPRDTPPRLIAESRRPTRRRRKNRYD